jgi:hypothetical protein
MQGKGAYNTYAALQATGGALAVPWLEEAARQITLDSAERPLFIADYGSSQGKNSLAPIRTAISVLTRLPRERPILVCHADLPANDFSELFRVLEGDPDSYLKGEPHVFPSAIGRSFYRQLFPRHHVDLGWSSYAALWLSRIPRPIPGHFYIPCSTGAVRAEFDRQAAEDWELFLSLRARELRPGGKLVVALPSLEDDGSTVWRAIMDEANAVLSEMVATGKISAEERQAMTMANCPRRQKDLLAPFSQAGEFRRLTVEHCGTSIAPDAAWAEYERDGNILLLAQKRALFFRATFVPSLLPALAPSRTDSEREMFADGLTGVAASLAGSSRSDPPNGWNNRPGQARGH